MKSSRESDDRLRLMTSDTCPDCKEYWIGMPNEEGLRKCRPCGTVWDGEGTVKWRLHGGVT